MSIEFIRPTKMMAYLKEKEIRISAEAKPKLIKSLNNKIKLELDNIIDKLPRFSKGEKQGKLKRITIKPEDVE